MGTPLSLRAGVEDSTPSPGNLIKQYRIEEIIGGGTAGVVFRARDLRLRRPVALKFLRRELQADQVAWGRMLHEARVISRLNHPGFCAIYEVGEDQGQVYIAMEYVAGRSLRQLLAGKGLPNEQIILYGSQLAAALTHAHERGIIHGDVKSSNVIVRPDGVVKLLDLGLALCRPRQRRLEEYASSASLAELGGAGGTLPYLAPEILRGERPSVQSDIWALGTLLYEMTGGMLPFTGRTCFEVSLSIMVQACPPLPKEAGSRLAAIIRRCLQKDCAQRYAAMREVREDIERLFQYYRRVLSTVFELHRLGM
jgi:serine/threonine-protein kinase